ncbi:IS5 family transposase, partial [Zwartia sp.]|uniref:IS5 family transposase n=1 Tax=Zwartia sp. TaxID=2978004 RepID=UPI0027206E50
RHPLVILASRMPWQEIEASLAHQFARQVKAGKSVQDIGLFGAQTLRVGGGVSNAGRPRLPIRLMVSLLYLKHAFNESDEGVVERWAEMPTWQYFSGMDYFEHRFPCDATLIGKFRKLIGEDGVEELLSQTISVALNLKAIPKKALETVVVDSTVQPKAIAHPTDSRLLEVARRKLVDIAKSVGIDLKQTFAKEGKQLTRKAGGYAHARQFRRMRKPINRQRTIVGRLAREIERQLATIAQDLKQSVLDALHKAKQLMTQTKHRKTKGVPKLYSWHAPEVEVIAKGKARTPYEFGVKVGITSTLKGNLILGARSFPNNPYDGHTLNEQLEQASILSNSVIKDVYVDLGYRGVDQQNPDVSIKHRGKYKSLTAQERRLLKRRQAIEPIIGHLKSDHRMGRCHLKGAEGDAIHAVLCAAGYNIRWLMRMIRKKGIRLLLRLIGMLGLVGLLTQSRISNRYAALRRGQLTASMA